MTVIKAADPVARRVRPPQIRVPVLPGHVGPAPSDSARLALEAQVAALEAELAEVQAQASQLSAALAAQEAEAAQTAMDHTQALAQAAAEARAAGRDEGAAAKDEALEVLAGAAERALDELRQDLSGLEVLAVALSRAALAKVFGEADDLGDRVARLVRRQLAEVERSAVLRIEVSAADFRDAAALEALGSRAGLSGIETCALDTLAAGDCRIRLRLGELEIGLAQQWGRLQALLDEALPAEAAP